MSRLALLTASSVGAILWLAAPALASDERDPTHGAGPPLEGVAGGIFAAWVIVVALWAVIKALSSK
jgi:hypothetical protein